MKVIVVGPSLAKQGSGLGWIKHNICSLLISKGHNVWSVHVSPTESIVSNMTSTIISKESREANDSLEIDEIVFGIRNSASEWNNIKELVKPELVICLGEPEHMWFVVGEEKDTNCKIIYYYLSEAKTMNRYIPISNQNGVYQEESLDLKVLFEEFDLVVPATETTDFALRKDMRMEDVNIAEPITPPVHRWLIDSKKASDYRKSISVEPTCRIYYSIAMNTPRKRLDQLLLYFRFNLLKKPCDKLVIHTSPHGAADIVSISQRLGITRNIRLNTRISNSSMEGVMSAGDVYVSLPAAEGYGLPLWESLLLDKPVIHTAVGYPFDGLSKLRGKKVTLLEAEVPYFYSIGNQVWYGITRNPKKLIDGIQKKGDDLEDMINTPSSFKDKFYTLLTNKGLVSDI